MGDLKGCFLKGNGGWGFQHSGDTQTLRYTFLYQTDRATTDSLLIVSPVCILVDWFSSVKLMCYATLRRS